jgi:hypothetical protein
MHPEQKQWIEINTPLGIALGYPECCVKNFGLHSPGYMRAGHADRTKMQECYKAGCIDGKFTGFIPCYTHAVQINSGKIKLTDLVKNRSSEFPPFPLYGNHE